MADTAARQRLTLSQPAMLRTRVDGQEKETPVTELTFPPPGFVMKARDLRCVDGHKGEVSQTIALIAHLTGEPVAVIDDLASDDFEKAASLVEGFRSGRPTGTTS